MGKKKKKQWKSLLTPEEAREQAVTDNALKALAMSDDEIRVGNYLLLFNQRDLEGIAPLSTDVEKLNLDGSQGEFFDPEVDIDSDYMKSGTLHVDYEHGRDPDRMGNDKDAILGTIDVKSITRDERGIWAERVLNRHHKYMNWMEELFEEGILGSSTEPVQSLVSKAPDGAITQWGLKRDTVTVTPMDFRMKGENILRALKAIGYDLNDEENSETDPDTKEPPEGKSSDSATEVDGDGTGSKEPKDGPDTGSKEQKTEKTKITGELTMFTTIKAVMESDLPDEVKEELITKMQSEGAPKEEPKEEPKEGLTAEDVGKAVDAALKERGVGTRKQTDASDKRPPIEPQKEDKEEDEEAKQRKASFDAVYSTRFGDEKDAQKAVLTDIIGSDYRQFLWDQERAFGKYLRGGERHLDRGEIKALKTQIYPFEAITEFVKRGMSVEELKTTMVESQGELGGFAVTPVRQSNILKRVRGLTAVRSAGATVVVLANGNSTEFPKYTGGDSQYVGALRGEWGGETKTSQEKNATLGLKTINAHIYTYKVPMSQSLVEDAANLVDLIEMDISDTLAIDEDTAFLVGSGAQQPRGILPASANGNSLSEVNSGHASQVTSDGIKALKRGVASQYRQEGIWVGESDTFGLIERLKAGDGHYLYPDLSDEESLLRRRVWESESMPTVAANAFPLLFGNMRGYAIVERLGLTIQRFQDSNTGLQKVEFHVRRRLGGDVIYPWMFAVQKISA